VWQFDYFGFKTLERSYLLKIGGKVGLPQHSYLSLISRFSAVQWKRFFN
jgi:hypothetical protein